MGAGGSAHAPGRAFLRAAPAAPRVRRVQDRPPSGDLWLALDSKSGFSSAGALRGAQSGAEAERPRGAPRGASARAGVQGDAQLALGQVVGWPLEPALRLRDGRTLGSLMLLLVIHRKKKYRSSFYLNLPLCLSPSGSPFSVKRIVPQCGAS